MDAFAQYLKGASEVLKAEFQRIKTTKGDSGVKGGKLENVVREFVQNNTACWHIANNSSLIDSYGNESMEQDLSLCNRWQTFKSCDNEKLICEGVDCIVQVKSQLNGHELDRIQKNCNSVKKLCCRLEEADRISGKKPEFKEYKVPYFALIGRSALKPDTIVARLNKNISEKQPDAIFIIDRGITLLNTAIGKGQVFRAGSTVPKKAAGWWTIDTGDFTLFHFLDRLNSEVDIIARFSSPVNFYFRRHMGVGSRTKMPCVDETYALTPVIDSVQSWRSSEQLISQIKEQYPDIDVSTGWANGLTDSYVKKSLPGRQEEVKKLIKTSPCVTIKNSSGYSWMRCFYIQYDLFLVVCDLSTKRDVEVLAEKVEFKIVRALDERDMPFPVK